MANNAISTKANFSNEYIQLKNESVTPFAKSAKAAPLPFSADNVVEQNRSRGSSTGSKVAFLIHPAQK